MSSPESEHSNQTRGFPLSYSERPPNHNQAVKLRVVEGLEQDAGHGIVRLTPEDLRRLGAASGDIVELSGKRVTAAKVETALQDQQIGTIQMDAVTRQNAVTHIGDEVSVRRLTPYKARRVVLAPFGAKKFVHGMRVSPQWRTVLEGRPVTVGDWIRVPIYGTLMQDYHVADLVPRGIALIQSATDISLKGQEEKSDPHTPKVSYEDIGGLGEQLQRVRELVELPLLRPDLFLRLGIEPPKGILLYGPPGCGKTLIARAVAGETSAYFIHVNGPEIMNQYYGESEARIRKLFEEAQENTPAIIFIDEIDAIAPKRDQVHGDVEKRVVAQLLALMDGLKPRGQVVVIGATNVPHLLDPALRRPGRFDREITVGIPDRNSRREILAIHSRYMPLGDDVDLDRLADMTHGFVGADLAALCREAAMHALRRALPLLTHRTGGAAIDDLAHLWVTQDDFLEVLAELKPSSLREVEVEVPPVGWSDVGGLDSIREALREAVEWPLKYGQVFKQVGVRAAKGILLYGPPGVGKTLVAQALANESGVNFISVKGPEVLSKWVGESERGIRELFRRARQAAPCILFFDEIDALAPLRMSGADNTHGHVLDRVVGQLMAEINGLERMNGVIVLGATNRPHMVDPALLQPGRLEVALEFPIPDREARLAIFQVHLRNKPLAEDVDYDWLVGVTKGLVGAHIESICRRAAMLVIQEFIESGGSPTEATKLKISMRHFKQAVHELVPQREDSHREIAPYSAPQRDATGISSATRSEERRGSMAERNAAGQDFPL
jgi:transitional endoplasmic reticulum ATPase